MRILKYLQLLLIISCTGFLGIGDAMASCVTEGCPAGQSCIPVPIDSNTSIYQCVNDPPVPEISAMLMPVLVGAGGYLAYRARRKHMKRD